MAESVIYLKDHVENSEHKFGEAKHYFYTKVVFPDGREYPGFLTKHDVLEILRRGAKNKEDVPNLDNLN